MAEASMEMRASEMRGEVWVKKWWQLFLQVWSWSGLAGHVAVGGKQADKCGLGDLEALGTHHRRGTTVRSGGNFRHA